MHEASEAVFVSACPQTQRVTVSGARAKGLRGVGRKARGDLSQVGSNQALSGDVQSHEGLDGDDPHLAQDFMGCHGDGPQASHH